MKIVVVHGEDTTRSYARFRVIIDGIKKRGWEVVRIPEQSLLSIEDVLRGQSLFGNQTLYTVDDGAAIPINQLKRLGELTRNIDGSLLVFYSKKVPATIRKSYPPDTKFEEFELPKIIFAYLEALCPGNKTRILNYLEELTANQPDELLIAMTARHLRDVYWMSIGGEGLTYPAWRKGKLAKQARTFAEGQLENVIHKLAEIDIAAKRSGASSVDLLKLLILREF